MKNLKWSLLLAASMACGAPPTEQIQVVDANPNPTKPETTQQQNVQDTLEGILTTQFVSEFNPASETAYQAGIGYDEQNIIPEINLRMVDAVDVVGKSDDPNFYFIEVPRERFTLAVQQDQQLRTLGEAVYGKSFTDLVTTIESPTGFYGKSYGFGRFPQQTAEGKTDWSTQPYICIALLGEDPTGRWLGYKFTADTADTKDLRAFTDYVRGKF